MTSDTHGTEGMLNDAERAHVAPCLRASGLLVAASEIATVESDGFCVVFAGGDGGCVWGRPSTRREIRTGLRPATAPVTEADHA